MTAPTLILAESDLLDPLSTFSLELQVLPPADLFVVASYPPIADHPAYNLVSFDTTPRSSDGLVWPTGVQRFGKAPS